MSAPSIYAASRLINPDVPPVDGGGLLVHNGTIVATGSVEELRRAHSAPVVEFPGCSILPGFVNAHTHLELTHFPAWKLRTNVAYNPRHFTDWIIQLIKIKRGLTAADYPSSLCEGIRLCLESGTTAVAEIVTYPDLTALYHESLLSGRLYFEMLGQERSHFNVTSRAALAAAHTISDRLVTGLSPHSLYTVAEQHLSVIREMSSLHNLPLSIHVSESSAETDFIFDSSGQLATEFYPFVDWERFLTAPHRCSSTQLLERHGLLTSSTLAVHCVHVSLSDARILKDRGVHVVLCPRSNTCLDVGSAPVALFKKLGIPLALGTDSLASNDSLSLWDEIRFALGCFPNDLCAEDVFRMVTSSGAAALGISAACGTLEVGKRADFQVVSGCSGGAEASLDRILLEGSVQEVFVGGVRYIGTEKS
ncbi:MAG TPA: amidohydrolase family protein [Desulfuromonadales bacterium]|nr:amidohydrolase family protein [Desulfuromonadales bacterium]